MWDQASAGILMNPPGSSPSLPTMGHRWCLPDPRASLEIGEFTASEKGVKVRIGGFPFLRIQHRREPHPTL